MFEKVLCRSKEEISALGWVSITHPDDRKKDMEQYDYLKKGLIDGYSMLKRYLRPDGSYVWVNMTVASLHINKQANNDHLCMIQDITDIMIARDNLQESEAKYKNLYLEYQKKQVLLLSLINSIPDLIFYKDFDGIYMGCNKAFEKFVGKKEDEIIGSNDYDLFDKETAESFRKMDLSMMKQKSQRKNEELVKYPEGEKVFLETLKTPYYDTENNVLGLIGVSRDITERKQKEEEILYLNYHDVLTGLYNRTFFEEAWKRLDERSQLPLSIIIGDINGLKLINNAFGNKEGDKLLVETARIIKSYCREEDIIARTGGDEFRILLPKTHSKDTKIIRDSIEKNCRELANRSDKGVYYTNISLGYATKNKEEESFEEIIEVAEDYMYKQKFLEHRSMYSSIIASIKTTVNEKSYETEEHAERMAALSRKLGLEVGLSEEELITLELATTLHDIGKISIDRNILTKPGKLTLEEWEELKKHPEVGYRITQTVPELRGVSEYILCHHERWDGKGYPQGLAGEDIPLLARILSVVDSYDAMTQDRSYKRGITKEEAIIEIENNAGTQFDPEIARIFIEKILFN
jgi:diguanylate cyclase (GGDEF)-like protein/PAS domain S-box-containing protein